MPRYRIDALVESDRDEENLAMYAEGLLSHLDVKDLSVYEVCHMPSHAEEARERAANRRGDPPLRA